MNQYPVSTQALGFGLACGSTRYVAAGRKVHAAQNPALYPLTWVPLDPTACAQLKVGTPAGSFIRTPDGKIYQLVGGQKRPIPSWDRYLQLNAGAGYLDVVPELAALIPTGAAA
jgi:hypothetical protein